MNPQPSTWAIFVAQLKADRKKASILGVLLLAMLGVYARWMFSGRSAPHDAAADAVAVQPVAIPTPQLPAAQIATPFALGVAEHVDVRPLSRNLARDLFNADLSAFEPSLETVAENAVASSRPSSLSHLFKSVQRAFVLQARRAEQGRAAVEADLAALHLQGTILGPQPKACINGRMVQENEIIGGFQVLSIRAREVSLQKSGCNVRLTMP